MLITFSMKIKKKVIDTLTLLVKQNIADNIRNAELLQMTLQTRTGRKSKVLYGITCQQ